jgi:RNA-directed DNA polymerase
MNGPGQSDSPAVPAKFPNKAGGPAAEGMEGRGLAKGNPHQDTAPRAQDRVGAPSALERVRQVAEGDKQVRFTTLLHHVYNIEYLRAAYFALKRDAAPGIDGETWQHYGEALEENLRDLSGRLARGAYRAKPVKRAYIAKADGRPRPLGIPTLEDKLVQRTTVEVLNAIYEADFLGFSYGFRPGRSPHHALDALYAGLLTRKVHWVLDLDIRGFFDAIDRGWLGKFVGHRIADRRVVRLIQKWLNAGVLEDGTRTWSETGTPQGGSISPLLANVYLHYAFDLWAHRWRKTHAHGDVIVVRYADDAIVGFQHRADAERFLAELRARFAKFGLELHPEKTRLLEFGPFAAENRRRAGKGKPETFNFLGFTHICGKKRNGRFTVVRQTTRKRLQAKLGEVKAELRRRMHAPDPSRGRVARDGRRRTPAVLRGADELAGLGHVPSSSGSTLVPHAATAWPAGATHLGADAAAYSALAAPGAYYSSLSPEATWRCYLRQEPSAVVPLAGIRGGGYEQSSIPTPTGLVGGSGDRGRFQRVPAPRDVRQDVAVTR